MARHTRVAPVGEYQPYNLSAATPSYGAAVGALLDTTSSTTIAAAGAATITLAAINTNVVVGTRLVIWNTSNPEIVTVTAVSYSAATVTATFANARSGTYNVTTMVGTKLGTVNFGALGTTMSLVLWNGCPGLSGATPPSRKIATITPAQQSYEFYMAADQGLWVVYTGTTAGDVTIGYLADPVSG